MKSYDDFELKQMQINQAIIDNTRLASAFGLPQEMIQAKKDEIYRQYSHGHYVANKKVCDVWGNELDYNLRSVFKGYDWLTKIVIIADTKSHGVAYNKSGKIETQLSEIDSDYPIAFNFLPGYAKFKVIQLADYTHMYIAYAPEIDTLFVRTLFDVIPTPVDPNDKMDIEARLDL